MILHINTKTLEYVSSKKVFAKYKQIILVLIIITILQFVQFSCLNYFSNRKEELQITIINELTKQVNAVHETHHSEDSLMNEYISNHALRIEFKQWYKKRE